MKDISTTEVCPRVDIAAYVDGELTPGAAAELEGHISGCGLCGRSLVEQRQFLAALDASLSSEAVPDLPDEFAKKIVVTAESSVTGLRNPNELFTAIFICAAIGLFALFALGGEALGLTSAAAGVADKLLAFSVFVVKLLAGVVFAAAVVVRALGAQIVGSGAGTAAIVAGGGVLLTISTRWAVRRRNA